MINSQVKRVYGSEGYSIISPADYEALTGISLRPAVDLRGIEMDRRLREYLSTLTPAEVDQTMLRELRQGMKDAVPEITQTIREREQRTAELRRGERCSMPRIVGDL